MDSDKRFHHVLEACGVNKSLMKLGVKEGDTVIVGEVCLYCLVLRQPQMVVSLLITHPSIKRYTNTSAHNCTNNNGNMKNVCDDLLQ